MTPDREALAILDDEHRPKMDATHLNLPFFANLVSNDKGELVPAPWMAKHRRSPTRYSLDHTASGIKVTLDENSTKNDITWTAIQSKDEDK